MKSWAGLPAAAALLLLGAAGGARAAPADFFSQPQASTPGPFANVPQPHKTYQFDNRGRWGVKLDVVEPSNRDVEWKDVTAGAYFRITPRVRVGGSVGLGDKFAQPQLLAPQDTGPRVRLETAFQF